MSEKSGTSRAELQVLLDDFYQRYLLSTLADGPKEKLQAACLMFYGENDRVMQAYGHNIDDDMGKAAFLELVKGYFQETGVYRYLVVSEVWMTQPEPGEPLIRPSKSERKKEALLVAAVSALDSIVVCYEIERNDDGLIMALSLPEEFPQGGVAFFLEMLDGQPVRPDVMKGVREELAARKSRPDDGHSKAIH